MASDTDTTTKATAPKLIQMTCLECETTTLYQIQNGSRNGSTATANYECEKPDCDGWATLRIGADSPPEETGD